MDRLWTHDESPLGKPTAATYRLGCRCEECCEANRVYLRDWRTRQQHKKKDSDGGLVYHTHIGRPSAKTAKRWECRHPRCLAMAGLREVDGTVLDAADTVVFVVNEAAL